MEELIHKLGINWKLLVAQAINFTVVLIVLYKFVYKPILKLLHNREKKIAQSLKDAQTVEENLKKSKIERENQVALGRKEGEKLIAAATKKADEVKQTKIDEAKTESAALVSEAKNKIRMERERMIDEVKNEVGQLVLLATKKITQESIDAKTHKKLIDQAVAELREAKL
ncbi:MAG: F0F1 ATP synthase subunit B [Patescibacteria group bacterium]